ncbi:hypothetical protein [Streptomyces virginiae]
MDGSPQAAVRPVTRRDPAEPAEPQVKGSAAVAGGGRGRPAP